MGYRQPDATDNLLTSEEDRIHQQALEALQAEVAQGRTFDQACVRLKGIENDLRQIIMDDFLKIVIAEEHFGRGRSMAQVARELGLGTVQLETVRDIMLEEVGSEMARQYRREVAKSSH